MKTLKSIGAILAAFIAVLALTRGTDFILLKTGVFPSPNDNLEYLWWMLLLGLIFRCVYSAAGGYIAASLAPSRPMRHTVIFGIIGIVFPIIGALTNWSMVTSSSGWYPISLILFTFPSIWFGGKLKVWGTNPETHASAGGEQYTSHMS